MTAQRGWRSVNVPEDLYVWAQGYAAEQERSVAWVMRRALERERANALGSVLPAPVRREAADGAGNGRSGPPGVAETWRR